MRLKWSVNIFLAKHVATRGNMKYVAGGLLGIILRLCCQVADFSNTLRTTHMIIDYPNRQGDQGELIGTTLAVYAADRATPEVFKAIKSCAFFFIVFANLLAKQIRAVRGRHHHKIVAADMPDKIIGITIFTHHSLTDTPNQANDVVAC